MLSPICKENKQELANYLLSRTQEISSDILVKVSNILDDVRKMGMLLAANTPNNLMELI